MPTVTGQAHLAAQSSLVTTGTVTHYPPALVDSILGVIGSDPILLGATSYLDTVFTSRLASDTE